jgi:8-oxo-dGTP diphosphatase
MQLKPKFCPHCAGLLASKRIDEKERLVCQECGFIFYINPKVAAGVLIEVEGRVLLVRRGIEPHFGSWTLPAGFTEYGETVEQTAIRECREETGLEIELDDLLGVYSVNSDFYGHLVLVLYSAHVVSGEMVAGDDASEVGLFAPAELPQDLAFQAHREALREWRESIEESVR